MGCSRDIPGGTPGGRPTSKWPSTLIGTSGSSGEGTVPPSVVSNSISKECRVFAAVQGTLMNTTRAAGGVGVEVTVHPIPRAWTFPVGSVCALSHRITRACIELPSTPIHPRITAKLAQDDTEAHSFRHSAYGA